MEGRYGPDAIFIPEDGTFQEDEFSDLVAGLYYKQGRAHISVSEGCTNPKIKAILKGGQVDEHGNVQLSGTTKLSDYLAALVTESLGHSVRVRADTYGYFKRSLPLGISEVDFQEARAIGRFAVQQAVSGDRDGSIIIKATRNPYKASFDVADLADVAAGTRPMPREYVKDHVITSAFVKYAMPLVGELPRFKTFI